MKINSNLKQIVKIANKLDELELFDSANTLTKVAVKLAQSFDQEYDEIYFYYSLFYYRQCLQNSLRV